MEQVNECDSSRSCRLKSELVGEDQRGGGVRKDGYM